MSRSTTVATLLFSTLALGSGVAMGAEGEGHHKRELLTFHIMFGVDGAFVGDSNPVAGIPGDELPWEISSARGHLDTDGNLFLRVKGVVFKDDPSVPENLRGINDEEQFRAAVACMTVQSGQVVERDIFTEGFPATPEGDSLIKAHVDLPNPCVAPIMFVLAGSENKWFAVTGFETEETQDSTNTKD